MTSVKYIFLRLPKQPNRSQCVYDKNVEEQKKNKESHEIVINLIFKTSQLQKRTKEKERTPREEKNGSKTHAAKQDK